MGPLRLTSPSVIVLVAMTTFAAVGCTDAPASPTTSVPFGQTDLLVGIGADALNGATVTMNYTGWLYDASKVDKKGLQFDSSVGRTAFSFTLGSGQVIKGWDQGIPGMRIGGKRRLVIPPSLAYGGTRIGLIPPNSTLMFDVELSSIQ
jgi:FKBP-type peptidyl-prolyl cis-trans isomerase FkpA